MGGKAKVARKIAATLKTLRQPGQLYLEPFCGAANIICEMNDGSGPCEAYDAHPDLILMWKAVQRGWKPPTAVSREQHRLLRKARPSALRGFVGFGCSFGGKFFSGYAGVDKRYAEPRPYADTSARGVLKKAAKLKGVRFTRAAYDTHNPEGALIYCDPPYLGTERFKGAPKFDHEAFWRTVRKWSLRNTVVVSEVVAPDDFAPVMEIIAPGGIRFADGSIRHRREFLFQHRSQAAPAQLARAA